MNGFYFDIGTPPFIIYPSEIVLNPKIVIISQTRNGVYDDEYIYYDNDMSNMYNMTDEIKLTL